MGLLLKLLSTGASGAFGLWSGIPAGQALGLPAFLGALAAVLGNLGAVAAVVAAHWWWERRLGRWVRKGEGAASRNRGRLERVWSSRIGLPGIAVLSPLLMGAPLGTLLALALGAPRGRLLRWMVASVAAWGVVLAGVTAFGLSLFGR
jgi:hypothetical protein